MKKLNMMGSLALAAAIALPIATTACAERRSYRVYDPYYHDYHQWNAQEYGYYHQWAGENHIDRDYRHLDRNDQDRYWQWRRNHGDHERDHDRDQH